MSCGKKKLVKRWEHPKSMRFIKQSRFEKNEASVKMHWKNVIKEMELLYKDDKFWESSKNTVCELVGQVIFERLAKIFNLPPDKSSYVPRSESDSFISSTDFDMSNERLPVGPSLPKQIDSESEFSVGREDFIEEEQDSESALSSWTDSETEVTGETKKLSSRQFNTILSRSNMSRSTIYGMSKSKLSIRRPSNVVNAEACTDDDIEVQVGSPRNETRSSVKNPHFDMLYCNESETDMIKWKSKYKIKTYEISTTEQYNKKAEIMTKKIATEFYEWWAALGSVEFKSEIKRPQDIEELFQLWFDEHASRGLVLHSKILPCVLKSIADYVGVPDLACPNVLKKHIADDIHAETSPAHHLAFASSLPNNLKHMPPRNNTTQLWKSAEIPEDLRTMACVWEDIKHLTSTKAFQQWLSAHPHLPMPICLRDEQAGAANKKALFTVPSDFVWNADQRSSNAELNLPVSKISFELTEVLSKLMNQ